MNRIEVKLDKSEYDIYDDYVNYLIDNCWLDEILEEVYPNESYGGIIPTLLYGMQCKKEEEIVWNRILPELNQTTICPLLMCPDDCDFSCILIVAEIENLGNTIKWKRLGVDETEETDPNKVGTSVNWLDKIECFEFKIEDYKLMISDFKKQYEIDKIKYEKQ